MEDKESRFNGAWLMAAFYVAAGVAHFVRTDFYVAMMPPQLPWHLGLVWLSGVVEIGLGIGVAVPRTRRVASWGVIALLVAVFPANIYAAMIGMEGAGGYVRLPLQALLIGWAWWYTR